MAKRMTSRADQDSPWKRILQQYFQEAIEFFFPEIAELVDWTQPPEFLDKEFVKIAPDAKVGRRFADQLVRVKLIEGKALVLLIHIEVQAAPEKQFAERIFVYSLRIFDYFRQPAVSVAILCDANPTWRPQQYGFSLPGTTLNFEFSTVKLLDYRDRMAELDAYEEERQMPYITSVERIGFERGVKEEAQRSLERSRSLILRQLTRKVGTIPDDTLAQINALLIERLELLGEALLDFESIDDLTAWLKQHTRKSKKRDL